MYWYCSVSGIRDDGATILLLVYPDQSKEKCLGLILGVMNYVVFAIGL